MVVGGTDFLAACQLQSCVPLRSHRCPHLRVKPGWSSSALCRISPHCPCSEVNRFRDTNSLYVSQSRAKQIAALKSPTTHCYKSIKHLQLTIQPPASAAEHVNSCDQIAAQLTAFTCAPTVPISKGEILVWLHPVGSRPVTRTRLFWGSNGAPWSLALYSSLGVGQRVSGQRHPGDSGTSTLASPCSPPGTERQRLLREARLATDPAGAGR